METGLWILGLAVALYIGYRLGAPGTEAVRPGVQPSGAPTVHEAEGRTAALYRAKEEVEAAFARSAHPSDLLSNPAFHEGVDQLRLPTWSTDELLGYYQGDSATIAAMALEALTQRGDGPDVPARVLASINDYAPWTRWFSVRLLNARTPAPEPLVGAVLSRIDESWTYPMHVRILQEFLKWRADGGETLTLKPYHDKISDDTAEALPGILKRMPEQLTAGLLAEWTQWQARRVDHGLLGSIGRVWKPGLEADESPVIEHAMLSDVVAQIDDLLRGEPSRSVLLVGEHGVGKTALVRALAERVQARGWHLFEAGHSDLIAGMVFIGELEERLRKLLTALRRRPVVWYVPDFHALALSGRHRYGPVSVLDVLLPILDKGDVMLVGETSSAAFEQLLQSKPRLLTTLETLRLHPLSETATLDLVDRWAERHFDGGAGLSSDIRKEAWLLAQQYLGDRAAPGNVLKLLELTQRRLSSAGEASARIESADLITSLTQLTGLPATVLDERQGLDLDELRGWFESRVMGQPEAVECLVERVTMIKAGVTDPGRPLGVFLFAGPTGTGKTEIAKALAEYLFGSERRMLRLDMSEFQTPESLDRILGGRDQDQRDGALVDEIRKQPFSVVLLDEFEKSHINVWDLFLQVFDDGRLTDSRGNTADFRNAIVILTSNLGSVIASGDSLGFNDSTGRFSQNQVTRAVERAFRKEFLNRLDRVVVFRPLERDTMRTILHKELRAAFRRRGLRNRAWAVEWDDSAVELLLHEGFTVDLGARPLRRAIERHLLAPLARTIVNHQVPQGDQFLFVRGEQGQLVVEFVDPDAPESGAEVDLPPVAGADEVTVAQVAFEPRGVPAELACVAALHRRLAATVGDERWQAVKRDGLSRMGLPGFWESAGRFEILSTIEYVDRIEAGLHSAGSLLERLTGGRNPRDRYPRDLLGRLAGQLFVLDVACRGVLEGQPREAFVSVEAWSHSGRPSRAADAFARRVGGMYRAWAAKRRMPCEPLDESGGNGHAPYRLTLAVSGYAGYSLLEAEQGLHVLELPDGKSGPAQKRAAVRVRVAPQPDTPAASTATGMAEQAREALDGGDTRLGIVRRYREKPSPLVRDSARGWRTGKLDRVLAGDFDLIGARSGEPQPAGSEADESPLAID